MTDRVEEPEAPQSTSVTLHFVATPTLGDVLLTALQAGFLQPVGLAVGTFVALQGSFVFAIGDALVGLVMLAGGIAMITGLFTLPFVAFGAMRRRDLILAPVEVTVRGADAEFRTSRYTSTVPFSTYRRAHEYRRGFVFETGTAAANLMPKRGVSEADLVAFRGRIDAAGLLKANRRRAILTRLIAAAIGAGAAVAVIGVPNVVALLTSTARLDISVSADRRQIAVRGSTDLPTGSIVSVQVVQLEEWEREQADGVGSGGGDSRWIQVRDVTVESGSFELEFGAGDWPPGRVAAIAYFWMDDQQPEAAILRFGMDGSGLRGPGVFDEPDTGPTLEARAGTELR